MEMETPRLHREFSEIERGEDGRAQPATEEGGEMGESRRKFYMLAGREQRFKSPELLLRKSSS